MLPRGRAWQPDAATGFGDTDETFVPATVMQCFWWAIAGTWKKAEDALNAILEEMFCETVSVDHDQWLEEYGLPNEADPYGDDYCAKSRAEPSDQPAAYDALLLELGYVTDSRWLRGGDSEFPGVRATLYIEVDADASEALVGPPVAGTATVGTAIMGPADLTQFEKIMDRIVPAHAAIETAYI